LEAWGGRGRTKEALMACAACWALLSWVLQGAPARDSAGPSLQRDWWILRPEGTPLLTGQPLLPRGVRMSAIGSARTCGTSDRTSARAAPCALSVLPLAPLRPCVGQVWRTSDTVGGPRDPIPPLQPQAGARGGPRGIRGAAARAAAPQARRWPSPAMGTWEA